MPISPNLNVVGNNVYEYTINDAVGAYRGKYTAMQGPVYACPEDSAFLTHTVRIREGEEYAIPDKEIALCMGNLLSVPETADTMHVNLFGYLGASVTGGVWSVEYAGGLGMAENNYSLNPATGEVNIPVRLIDIMDADSVVFKYTYKDCTAKDTFTLLTLKFKEDFREIITDREKDVCRNLVSGVIDLPSTFGFSMPLTAGLWYETINGVDSLLLSGSTDISNRKSGSLYTFRFDVSSAVDSICYVGGTSTVFGLRIQDIAVSDATARICKNMFKTGTRVDLSRYVPGLNDPTKIDPNIMTVTWYDSAGVISSPNDPKNYELKAVNESQTELTAPNVQLKFNYEVQTECGPYTGNLYITAVDSIPSSDTVTVRVCYTDSYAYHIDLAQALGVVVNGRFQFMDEESTPLFDADAYNELRSVFNANRAFDPSLDVGTYMFKYVPSASDCVSDKIRVKVVVTKVPDEYKQK
jgi:hypothetical protein